MLAIGGDLSAERLLAAYRSGIFPWFDTRRSDPLVVAGPSRLILLTESSGSRVGSPGRSARVASEMRYDTAFAHVIRAFADSLASTGRDVDHPGDGSDVYMASTQPASLHSLEAGGRRLVGGIYGVRVGRVFFGESMFHLRDRRLQVALRDPGRAAQLEGVRPRRLPGSHPEHLERFGARAWPRALLPRAPRRDARARRAADAGSSPSERVI